MIKYKKEKVQHVEFDENIESSEEETKDVAVVSQSFKTLFTANNNTHTKQKRKELKLKNIMNRKL